MPLVPEASSVYRIGKIIATEVSVALQIGIHYFNRRPCDLFSARDSRQE